MDVVDLRAKLREACGECYTCTEEEADVPTDEMLVAWMASSDQSWGEHLWGGGLEPAWSGHLRREWLLPSAPPDPNIVVRYGSVVPPE